MRVYVIEPQLIYDERLGYNLINVEPYGEKHAFTERPTQEG